MGSNMQREQLQSTHYTDAYVHEGYPTQWLLIAQAYLRYADELEVLVFDNWPPLLDWCI